MSNGNMLKIKTTRFGIVETSSDKIINFPHGIVGLEELKNYILDPIPWKGYFGWMQSTESPDIAFVITDPWFFCPDYEIKLSKDEKNILSYSEEADVVVYVIVLVADGGRTVTANLFAPVVINRDVKIGKQLVLEGSNYPMKYDLLAKGGG